MIEGEPMQLIYLGVVVVGVLMRNIIGWLQSKQSFNWRQFLVSTIPAVFVIGAMAFDVEPVWNLETAFALFVASGGFAEFQGKAINSKKFGDAFLTGPGRKK